MFIGCDNPVSGDNNGNDTNNLRDLTDEKAPCQKPQIYSCQCANFRLTLVNRMEACISAEARKANTWAAFGLYIFLVEEKTALVSG